MTSIIATWAGRSWLKQARNCHRGRRNRRKARKHLPPPCQIFQDFLMQQQPPRLSSRFPPGLTPACWSRVSPQVCHWHWASAPSIRWLSTKKYAVKALRSCSDECVSLSILTCSRILYAVLSKRVWSSQDLWFTTNQIEGTFDSLLTRTQSCWNASTGGAQRSKVQEPKVYTSPTLKHNVSRLIKQHALGCSKKKTRSSQFERPNVLLCIFWGLSEC